MCHRFITWPKRSKLSSWDKNIHQFDAYRICSTDDVFRWTESLCGETQKAVRKHGKRSFHSCVCWKMLVRVMPTQITQVKMKWSNIIHHPTSDVGYLGNEPCFGCLSKNRALKIEESDNRLWSTHFRGKNRTSFIRPCKWAETAWWVGWPQNS